MDNVMTRASSSSPMRGVLNQLGTIAESYIPCMLMSADDRYISYKMEVHKELGEVHIHRADSGSRSKFITYDLHETHICSIDSVSERNISPEGGMYCINLQHKKSRKLYFVSYNNMCQALSALLEAQGFPESRLS